MTPTSSPKTHLHRRRYDIHGLSLCVESASRTLLDHADELLAPFTPSDDQTPQFRMEISQGDAGEADFESGALRCCWRQPLPSGVNASGWVGGDVRGLYIDGLGCMKADLGKRSAELTIAGGREISLGIGLLIPTIAEFLATLGQHACHAASLQMPGDPSRCVLLLGCSGAGKTTTSLALHKAGMTMMADDCTVLVADPDRPSDRPRVWGFPRPCKVHRNTLKLLGWLDELVGEPPFYGDECILPMAKLGPVNASAMAEPAAMLFLQKRNDADHRVEPLTRVQAVAELARGAVRYCGPEGADTAARAFKTVVHLACTCPALSMSVGPDVASLPEVVLSAVEASG